MKSKKLTVALTTYNRQRYLKSAIDAILEQTYTDFELQILDNGSSIETINIINQYKDSRIKIIRNEINNLEFINSAFEIALGEYLIITHDDDIMEKEFLQREIEILENNPTVEMVATNISKIDSEGKLIKRKTYNLDNDKKWNQFEYIKFYCLHGNIIPCPTIMMRTNTINKYKLRYNWTVGPMVDLYLIFQINLLQNTIYLIKDPLYRYRIHEIQASEVNRTEMEIQVRPYIMKLLSETENKKLMTMYDNSSRSQILFLYFIQLILGQIDHLIFQEKINLLYSSYSAINKYSIFWGIKGLLRGLKIKYSKNK